MAGFAACFKHEEAFRQEVYALIILIPLGFWWGQSPTEQALLIGVLLLIPLVELLNSGIEAVVDRVGPELHPLSGRAKDIGSAAVFMSLLMASVVWAIILLPRIFA
jgi:diacylglycerol kinase (ATP)